ncbi:SusC/RagA family TonB-linked outer membrane protein [Carboxylicivirga linearis]|uniref:TonB-dependent receptor n=1 Tax=Carboxylicivirga linearis TaxID=1628157 RepID=A0ABS5JTR6_9BACT|nr:TonB-dependent receptor [Carboxylicivirga linearis]MBS2098294.1 TonB-dependent receptor [Carboxylicivirga linearis]
MKKRVLFLIIGLCMGIASYAQVNVTGKVTDTQGSPIPGVTVSEKGTSNGIITDIDGNYSLSVNNSESIIAFSFIGMDTQEIVVGNQSTINVVLEEELTDLDEVVVIGYGVQKKKLTTGANLSVDGDDLQKLNTVSALEAMQSQAPGMNITQSSGMPGEGFKVNIRGLGTTGNASPLYVIDGVAGLDINTLNPADIESIDVLKDAASAAIYGARAANGVILVTTKKGKAGKVQVSYDGYYGVQNAQKIPPLLNASEYMTIMNEIRYNEGLDEYDWATLIPGIYEDVQNGWEGTNWLKEIENANAPTQNHAINITGGSEMSNYSLGFSYTSQEGIYGAPVEPNFERYTTRINSDHVIYNNDKWDVIKVGETMLFNFNQRNGIGIGNIYWNDIHNMLVANPLMPVYGSDGDYYNQDDAEADGLDQYSSSLSNPIGDMVYNRGQNLSKNYSLQTSAYLEIQPIQGLTLRSRFGYQMNSSSYRSYVPAYSLSQVNFKVNDEVSQSMSVGHRWTLDNTISYDARIGEHSFDIVAGQSVERWGLGESMGANNINSVFNDFEHAWLDNTQGITPGETSVSGSPWGEGGISSFFGRINYNYKETYMLSLVMRADASTNFAKGKRWGYFPSVSAGWVMTNESFMSGMDSWLNFFKWRASWGQNGNQSIAPFQYLATVAFDLSNAYSFGNTKTDQTTGGYADILPNPDVTWETSEQLDLGFDARFINSRLGVAFDYYIKTTRDWLVMAPILATYGTGAPDINGGDVENKGIEVALNWNDNIGDFTYGVNFNIAKNKNEVTRLDNAEGIIRGDANVLSQGTPHMYRAEVGKPMGYFYGYKTAGVFQNQEQINNAGPTLQSDPEPGDLIFVDTNGDGVIDENDKTEIGNPNPDFRIGFSFNLGYKGFDLSVATNGAFGHQIAKSYRSFADSYQQNFTTDIFERWHGEGTSNRLPKLSSGSNSNWQEISDIYIEDADFLKIQNVTVGYDFKKLLPSMPFSKARLYFAAQNLYTFTNYTGMDPEVGYGVEDGWASGIDLGFYPSARTYMVGVNLNF